MKFHLAKCEFIIYKTMDKPEGENSKSFTSPSVNLLFTKQWTNQRAKTAGVLSFRDDSGDG